MLTTLEAAPVAQMSLPGMLVQLCNKKSQALGTLGEKIACQRLTSAGYTVTTLRLDGSDLRAINPLTGEIFTVEVKTARRGKDKKWRFMLQNQRTTHQKSDLVMLQQVFDSGHVETFIIPSPLLGNMKHIAIPSGDYKGKWAAYRQSSTPHLETVI